MMATVLKMMNFGVFRSEFKILTLSFFIVALLGCCEKRGEDRKFSLYESSMYSYESLLEQGYNVINYTKPFSKDTVIMQEYYVAFLLAGNIRILSKSRMDTLQQLHEAYLWHLYDKGLTMGSGPFSIGGEVKGITIFNTRNIQEADSLMSQDPKVKAGVLKMVLNPWWAPVGLGPK